MSFVFARRHLRERSRPPHYRRKNNSLRLRPFRTRMGNACDCSVLFNTSSHTGSTNNERSYGEGLTENDSPLPQTPQISRHRTHDSNNTTAHNGIRKINFSPATPGHNRDEPRRHSHNHSPSVDDTDSSFDETQLMSPIPTNGPSRVATAEEQMWEDLRRDLRVLDANLTMDTEKLDNLPLDAAMGNSGRKATSHKGTGAGGTHPSGSNGQQGYSGMNLGSLDMDKGDTSPTLSSRSSSVSSIGRRDIMLEAEEVLRSMDREEKGEQDSGSEEDGFWENDGMGLGLYMEEDEVSNVHDSWDQKLG